MVLATTVTLGCTAVEHCDFYPAHCADVGAEHATDGTGDETGGSETEEIQFTVNKNIDILFVIDNSSSMGQNQANLAASFPMFVDVLEDAEANYRIGITTTDNGNPWCPAGQTTPEGGKLVLSSCKTRIGDFLFGNDVDMQDLACNDICNLDTAALEILPTTTDVDPEPKSHPWLESIEGQKNIPETTDMAAAFACFGPQGVNGCGFESHLESMYLALTRAQTNTEVSYGFLRASANLAIVIVTDETDCSYNKDYAGIFEADGNKVFWSDPTAEYPTSAVCWNAGVECMGDPSSYDSCDPVNKDVNGNVGVSDANAVLHPMSRYIGLVQGLEQEKQEINPQQEIIIALIGGVSQSGDLVYADIGEYEPEFQEGFGIGPGCYAPNPLNPNETVTAIPPVRERDMVNAFTPGNMFSVCEADYSPALLAIANRIKDQFHLACYTNCVKDTDPDTTVLDPECTVEQNSAGNIEPVIECLRDAGGYFIDPNTNDYMMPADGVNVCYALLTDSSTATSSTTDDMSPECIERNVNLEFKFARRAGFPAAEGTSISATCLLAESSEVTCPGLES